MQEEPTDKEEKDAEENLAEKPKEKPIHQGHRERVKNQFLRKGLDGLEPHVILELLLYYGVPRRDTNPIAHQLLDTFGSISAVLEAPLEELVKIKGVTMSAATLLKLIPQLSRVYLEDLHRNMDRLYDTKTTGEFLLQKFIGRSKEAVVLLLIDSKGRKLYCDVVNEGALHMVPIYTRDIIALSVRYNAATAILAHNHPSGDTMPSSGDITATRHLYEALRTINVELEDHFIIADGSYISMEECGLLERIRNPYET